MGTLTLIMVCVTTLDTDAQSLHVSCHLSPAWRGAVHASPNRIGLGGYCLTYKFILFLAVLAQHVTDDQDEDMLDAGNHLKQFKIRPFFSFRYSLLLFNTL